MGNNKIDLFLIYVLFFYLLLFIRLNQAIKCWSCRSDTDPKCADPFDNKTLPIYDCDEVKFTNLLIDRDSKPTVCRKIRQKVKGKWSTIRSCAILGEPGEGTGNENHCLIKHGTHDIYVEYCTCNSKDGCNLYPCLNPNLFLYLFFTAIIFIKKTLFFMLF